MSEANIKIAKYLGWHMWHFKNDTAGGKDETLMVSPSYSEEDIWRRWKHRGVQKGDGRPECPFLGECNLPDYENDLNAMHEAEKSIENADEWVGDENSPEEAYFWQIHRAIGTHDDWNFLTASAKHRAEAFIKTLNL